MVKINNIINNNKFLAKGMNGSVYLVKDNKNNKYALKIQQIMQKDTKKNLSSKMWREIDFALKFAKKYPDHFMQLYDYKFDNKCNYKHSFEGFNFELKDLPTDAQTYYKKLWVSPYCSIKLWSYVDTTLNDLLNSWKSFNENIYYDFVIQMIYIIYLMNKEGYFHNDFHQKNIGLKKTKKKYINIFNKKIPTHGYLVQAIDYELNLHKKYKLTPTENTELENNNDIFSILYLALFDFADLKFFYKKEKIDFKFEEYKIIDISKEDENILAPFLEGVKLTKYNHKFLMNILYKVIFYEKFEKNILGNKFIKAIPPKLYIPLDCILYMIKNIYEPEKIIRYLIKNK